MRLLKNRLPVTVFALLLAVAGLATVLTQNNVWAQTPGGIRIHYPGDGSTNVYAGTTLRIEFPEDMNRGSVEAAFSLQPNAEIGFTWHDGRNLEIAPREPLELSTTYVATLQPTLRTAGGRQLLTTPFSWDFTTWSQDPQGRLGSSLPVAIVATDGTQGIAQSFTYPRLTLDFTLYNLSAAGFAERLPELEPYAQNAIPIDGLTVAHTWTAHFEAESGRDLFLPDYVEPGLYVLEASSDRIGTPRALIAITDYALVAKAGQTGWTAWAAKLPEGAPAPGASVTLYDESGNPLDSGVADDFGIAQLAAGDPILAAAEIGGQTTVVGVGPYWRTPTGNYWWWWGWGGDVVLPDYAAHIHTDRPIYRPGHTVHYKGTFRHLTGDGYELPAPDTSITVTLKDATGNTVRKTTTTLDWFGSFHGDLVLSDEVSMGAWSIEASIGSEVHRGSFQVEDYVKPDYEVLVETDRPWYVKGDSATVTVQADYYFGQPAAEADVAVRLYVGYYSPDGSPAAVLEGQTDASGAFTGQVALPSTSDYAQPVFIEAAVTDASRRPVAGTKSVTVYPADFELSLRNDQYGVEVGEPVRLTVQTSNHDGGPMPGRAVSLQVRRYVYRTGYEVVADRRVTTDAEGRASVAFDGLSGGWYNIVATAVDDGGRRLERWSYAWVTDQNYRWYWSDPMEITPDRDGYEVGDTARLLIRSPISTTALVTLERDDVYEELVVDVAGATEIEIPIDERFVPSVTARVQLWQPEPQGENGPAGSLLTAEVRLPVEAATNRVNVEIASDAEEYAPGEPATFVVRVTDANGAPVDAQLSLALVDKAVLALAQDTSGDIFDAFWSPRDATVSTYDSLRTSLGYGYPEDRAGDGGGPPAPGGPAGTPTPASTSPDPQSEATPRRFFPDTAYWNATLETGPDGEVEITLDVPDTLTTWVAAARAITRDTRAGEGRHEILVTKAIIADPALPRFAVQGDRFALDVLARNYAGGTLTAQCEIEAPGLVVLDPGTRDIEVPFNTTRVGRWSVVASKLGENLVTASVETTAGSDVIELPLEVAPFTVPDRFVSSGSTDSTTSETVTIPFNAVPGSSKVEARLAPAMALGVLDGLEDLIGYPYGCVEQTMSRVLPNAVVGRLVLELDLTIPEIIEQLPAMTDLGLQKLYGFQNSDGSWGWWHGEGNVHTTSYVLFGLVNVEASGTPVDPDVLDKGFTWLAAALASEPDPRIRAFAVHVMALGGKPADEALLRGLAADADALDAFSLAALALALDAAGLDAQSDALLDDLEALAVESATTAHWPMVLPPDKRWEPYHWRTMASAEKNTGLALQALAQLRSDSPLAPKAARWLLENRWGRGWRTTQATAYAVLGLTDWILASGELESEFDWRVSLNGTELAAGHVDRSNILEPIAPVALSPDEIAPGSHTLTFEKSGNGVLYYTLLGELALYHDGFVSTEPAELGLGLRREYSKVEGKGTHDAWAAGDLINVRLTVDVPEDVWYVLVEDMLPAGLEAINTNLDTERKRTPETEPGIPWRWWGYERKEIRDDKVTFFATYLPAGTHQFEYAARAVTPGEFAARPGEAYAMYRPEVWGRSGSDKVVIAPEHVLERPPLSGDFDGDCRVTDFDASLAADAWSGGSTRDANRDGRQDVADVTTARGRAGAACGDSTTSPGRHESALDIELRESSGGTLEIVATADGAVTDLAGFELVLEGPGLSGATFAPADAEAWVLGPAATGNRLKLAFVGDGQPVNAGTVLGRIEGVEPGAGESTAVAASVATDSRGAEYRVTHAGIDVSPRPIVHRIFVPSASQR